MSSPLLVRSAGPGGLCWHNNSLVCRIYSTWAVSETFLHVIIEKYLRDVMRLSGNSCLASVSHHKFKYLHSSHSCISPHPSLHLTMIK